MSLQEFYSSGASPQGQLPPLPNKRVLPATPFVQQGERTRTLPAKDPILLKLRNLILENPQEELLIEDLPRILGFSRAQIYRKIKNKTGLSPSRFICGIRLELALPLLQNTTRTISDIAFSVGFNDPKYFNRVFQRKFNQVPSAVK